ncbi:MAG: hypothetical protein A2286_00305 [Gammaproteobacteria bacterium RIFOXYA12_FULL_61_12]|nr:MAG: hypothetical protein A2286_00305 [Gammaproteobacteria bacterium RIFOXYA12_FULL_61_12]
MASDSSRNSQLNQGLRSAKHESDPDLVESVKSVAEAVEFLALIILILALIIMPYALDRIKDAPASADIKDDKSSICSIEGSPVEVDKAPMSSRQDHSIGGALASQ